MSFDIYEDRLRRGYCEVHPDIHEEYPCSACLDEWGMIKQQEEMESEYWIGMEREYYEKGETDYYSELFAGVIVDFLLRAMIGTRRKNEISNKN